MNVSRQFQQNGVENNHILQRHYSLFENLLATLITFTTSGLIRYSFEKSEVIARNFHFHCSRVFYLLTVDALCVPTRCNYTLALNCIQIKCKIEDSFAFNQNTVCSSFRGALFQPQLITFTKNLSKRKRVVFVQIKCAFFLSFQRRFHGHHVNNFIVSTVYKVILVIYINSKLDLLSKVNNIEKNEFFTIGIGSNHVTTFLFYRYTYWQCPPT